jgi:hypothetical protein
MWTSQQIAIAAGRAAVDGRGIAEVAKDGGAQAAGRLRVGDHLAESPALNASTSIELGPGRAAHHARAVQRETLCARSVLAAPRPDRSLVRRRLSSSP